MTAAVASATAALLLYDEHGGLWLGSAICLRLGDRRLLATAAHNLHRVSHLRAIPGGRYRSDPIRLLAMGRGQRDAAWVEVSASDVTSRHLCCLRLDDLDRRGPGDQARLLAHGFPSNGVDPKRVAGTRFELEAAQVRGRSVTSPSPEALALKCDPRDAGADFRPSGISGGGIWRRAADGRYRLAGLARAWQRSDRLLLGIPIEDWLRLVARDFPELRELLGIDGEPAPV